MKVKGARSKDDRNESTCSRARRVVFEYSVFCICCRTYVCEMCSRAAT